MTLTVIGILWGWVITCLLSVAPSVHVCSFNLGEPLNFLSCLWSFISATSAAFTFPFSMIVLSAYQNHHSAACHFISKLIRGGCKLFLVVQVTFLLCPCLSYCEHSSASLPLDFTRLSSERRVTLDEQVDRNVIENLVDIVVIWTLKLSENCEMVL